MSTVHEQIDAFSNQSPRVKAGIIIVFVLVIIAVVGGLFYFGTWIGDTWASARYNKKSAENAIKIAKAEAEYQKLTGVNETLKKQNEELAAERDKADKRLITENAERDRVRAAELQAKVAEIDQQSTAPAIICATCEAQRKAGYPLSTEFCGQCYQQP